MLLLLILASYYRCSSTLQGSNSQDREIAKFLCARFSRQDRCSDTLLSTPRQTNVFTGRNSHATIMSTDVFIGTKHDYSMKVFVHMLDLRCSYLGLSIQTALPVTECHAFIVLPCCPPQQDISTPPLKSIMLYTTFAHKTIKRELYVGIC